MNELALFAGVGGGLLASRLLGWKTVCAVEKDPYCAETLLRRQEDGFLEPFPIWDDIRTFSGSEWRGTIDIVTAGFPCQAFSSARVVGADPTLAINLWPENIRIIREVGSPIVLLENVRGLLGRHGYFGTVLGDLAQSGYAARWMVLSAAEMGAPHKRDRVWIVAYSKDFRPEENSLASYAKESKAIGSCNWWSLEPSVGRVVDGVPYRMDRLRSLGNAQVPEVARQAFLRLELIGQGEQP